MKNRFVHRWGMALCALFGFLGTMVVSSCSDDYDLDETKPSFLGESVYDELKNAGNFTYEMKLIDDLDYADVLSKTGSKTLFVANDDAFEAFFKTTTWKDGSGNYIRSYDQLSTNQKRILLYGSMLNNAYVMEMLANTSGSTAGKNMCLRRITASTAVDTIPYWNPEDLPKHLYEAEADESSTSSNLLDFWNYYRSGARGGIYMAVDGTDPMMTHFLEGYLANQSVKHSDVQFALNLPEGEWAETSNGGEERSYIYNRRVIEPDITCMNGYYNVIDSVLVTPNNMAEIIRTTPELSLFSSMLERFSAPYYDAQLTAEYSALHDIGGDSVFVKRYISQNSSKGLISNYYSNGTTQSLGDFPTLAYDPGWNEYAISSTITRENDMAAMFVPNNDAIAEYFMNGGGVVVMERYAKQKPVTVDNLEYNLAQVPLSVVASLLNNLMKDSFRETVPSKYLTIMNDAQDQMFDGDDYASEAEYRALFERSILANNGVVYVMNKVISPADYAAVSAPVLLSTDSRIVNAVVRADEAYVDGSSYNNAPLKQYFSTYLKAMQSRFSFFVPTDAGLGLYGYVDPVSIASGVPNIYRYWRFEYGSASSSTSQARLPIRATAYKYSPSTGQTASDAQSTGRPVSLPSEVLSSGYGPTKRALLIEMVNHHIVVHENDDADGMFGPATYYTSRLGAPVIVKTKGSSSNNGVGMVVEGGFQKDLETDEYDGNESVCTVTAGYDMTSESNGYGNGMTYFLDRPMQPTMHSVYYVMSNNDQFSEFFNLCSYFSSDLLEQAGFRDQYRGQSKETTLWTNEQNKYRIFTNLAPYYPAANEQLIRFFNNYRYTIYLPTNSAMQQAYDKGLPTWEQIEYFVSTHLDEDGLLSDDDKATAQAMIVCLVNFLKYHFQDEAFYVDNVSNSGSYQTSCIDNVANAYLQLQVSQTPGALSVTDESGATVSVNTSNCNILASDMNFNASPTNTTSARYAKNTSYAAIHQIDTPLTFKTLTGGRYDSDWSTATRAKKFAERYKLTE